MIESFVDLTYRGLPLGRRVKLTSVRPSTGYLEVPTPMPVGTSIAILTDDTVALEAIVVEIHEQVGGSDRAPGMVVRPKLEAQAAKKWWDERVTLPEAEKKPAPAPPVAAAPLMPMKRVQRDTQIGTAVPEVLEDGHDTAVIEVPDVAVSGSHPSITNPSLPAVADDGKATTMMDAVDLAALGLTSPSGQMPAVTESGQFPAANGDDDDEPDPGSSATKKPSNGGGKKRKKRR